jgi:hypothetical protein
MRNVQSPKEHREFLRRGAEYHRQAPQLIAQQVVDLEHILERYDPLDVIANVSFINLSANPETYKEWAHEGQQAYVEYVTLLCLKKRYHTPSDPRHRLIDGRVLEDIQNRLEQIHYGTIWFHGTRYMDSEKQTQPSLVEELRFKTVLHELGVRNPGYPQHLEELLRGLFEPLTAWMESSLGFSIEDAIAFEHAIGKILNDRMLARRETARAEEKNLRKQVRALRNGRPPSDDYPEDMIAELAGHRDDKMRRAIRNVVVAWTFFALGDTYAFTGEEVAAEAERPTDRAQAFLDRMSIRFGEVDKDFSMPAAGHPLRTRPIVQHDARYLCPIPGLLMWGLRPALEGTLKTDPRLWERYQRARSGYLESRSLELLSQALGGAPHYRRLKFPKVEGDGEDELDGLLTFDRCLFLVECKAGGFSPAARRGAEEPMLHGLKDLVADAHSQALKARRYIAVTDSPTFVAEDGTAVTIDKARFDRVLLVTTTLEPLDVFTPVLHKVADLGIFEAGDLPWAVYLLDLAVISQLIEFPGQLIHYLDRRLRLHEAKNVEAGDELDWFGHYLHEGLSLEDLQAWPADRIQLLSYTTSMDDYFLHQAGERQTPAPKPAQPMPKKLRQIITELETERAEGYVDVVCHLLDMGADARKRFVKSVDKIRERSRRDGGDHDFYMLFSGADFGLSVLTGLTTPLPKLTERMQAYCVAKKYQTKMNRWVGLVSHLALRRLVHAWVMLTEPWRYDGEMEEVVTRLFTRRPRKR